MKYTFNKRLIFLVATMTMQAFTAERSLVEYRGRRRAEATTAYAERAHSDDDTPELSPAYRVCVLGIRDSITHSREARTLFITAFNRQIVEIRSEVGHFRPMYSLGSLGSGPMYSGNYIVQPTNTLNMHDVAYESELRKAKFQAFDPLFDMVKDTVIEAARRCITYVCPSNEPFLHPDIDLLTEHGRDAFIESLTTAIRNCTMETAFPAHTKWEHFPNDSNYKEFVKFTHALYGKLSDIIEGNLDELAAIGAPHPLKNITVHAKGRSLKERLLAAIA